MNKRIKTVLIIVFCIIAGLIVILLAMNNLVPFMKSMHGMH